ILGYSEEELVSQMIIGRPESGIIDSKLTQVDDADLVTVYIWYDNEYGYSNRMLDLAMYSANATPTIPGKGPTEQDITNITTDVKVGTPEKVGAGTYKGPHRPPRDGMTPGFGDEDGTNIEMSQETVTGGIFGVFDENVTKFINTQHGKFNDFLTNLSVVKGSKGFLADITGVENKKIADVKLQLIEDIDRTANSVLKFKTIQDAVFATKPTLRPKTVTEAKKEFNLIVEKTDISTKQFDMALAINEIVAIKENIGANLVCEDANSLDAQYTKDNSVVVALTTEGVAAFKEQGFERIIFLNEFKQDQYLDFASLSMLGKGIYIFDKVDEKDQGEIRNMLNLMYSRLTGDKIEQNWDQIGIAAFILNLLVTHAPGVMYTDDDLKNLHMAAKAAIMAA
ncbi:MAG: hypothetical protein V2A72_01080, partial [Candidatus Omnitrophota bacterium]